MSENIEENIDKLDEYIVNLDEDDSNQGEEEEEEDDNNQGEEEEEDNNEGEEEDDNNKGDKEKKDLKKIIKDFLVDLLGTFPELYDIFDNNLKNIHDNVECDKEIENVKNYITTFFPERFFDILYKNDDIFKDYKIDTKFLPGIDFSILWNDNNISDNSRDIIWKHLQVILFVIIGDIDEKHLFGESQKMFEEVNEKDLKEKLFETISNIQDMFDLSDGDLKDISGDGILPDPENIHNHLNSLLDGKLGSLAKEIAEETVNDMDLKVDDDADPEEVFNKLFKNPSKLMNMATSVGKKLDSKIKEGTLKESELLEEATELMEKMKNMPGMEKMESLFKNMPGMNGAKIDKNAMQNKLNNNLKTSKMKERMRKKLDERKKDEEKGDEKDREINVENMEKLVFSTGENVEKSIKKKKKNKKGGGKK
tara:strand:+ start:3840 stop:5108 length:1269 start_codon:yes stop_codon:yes gene_type:complete